MVYDCVQDHLAINLVKGIARGNEERYETGIPPVLSHGLVDGVDEDLGLLRGVICDLVRRVLVARPGEDYFYEGAGYETPGDGTNSVLPLTSPWVWSKPAASSRR